MRLFILLLFICFSLFSSASGKTQDIIYLKNGSVIYGTIQDKSDKIKIRVSGGSVFVYNASDIDSIKQESLNKALKRDFFTNYYRKTKGFRNITEIQFTYEPQPQRVYAYLDAYPYYGSDDDIGVGVHTINGYQFNPYLFLGGGLGFDRLLSERESFVPLYARIQTEVLNKRITPYFFGDIGYAFMVADQVSSTRGYAYYHRIGGLYTTLGGGIHIYTKGPLSYMVGVGYRRNYSEIKYGYDYSGGPYDYVYKSTYQRLVVSWALTF